MIPPLTETLDSLTFRLIKQFVDDGGKLITFSSPTLINGAPNQEASVFFSQKTANIIQIPELTILAIQTYFQSTDLKFENLTGGNLFHNRRLMEDGQLIFMANSSMDNSTTGSMSVTGKDAVLLNAFTGEIIDYPEVKDGENIRISFLLHPAGSLLLFISNKKLEGYKQPDEAQKLDLVEAKQGITVKRDDPNVLPIDFCDLEIGGKTMKGVHISEASQKVFTENGFPEGNPWNHSVQYKTSITGHSGFDMTSGFVASYKFTVNGQFDFSAIKAVVERPELWTVSINGHNIKANAGEWWMDHSFGVFAIGSLIKIGDDIISVKYIPMNIDAEIEPVYLVGDFSVEPADKGWKIDLPKSSFTTGSWKEQGQPFYSWDVSYTKKFEIAKKSSYYEIGLGNWKGTVAKQA